MALEKKIISENGIIMNYHIIDHFETDTNINIFVKSYADQSYRQQEKEIKENYKLANSIRSQISEEMAKEGTDAYNKELIQQLTAQANELGFPVLVDLSILTRKFEYPLDKSTEFSYKTFYTWLKTEEIFKDAIDVSD